MSCSGSVTGAPRDGDTGHLSAASFLLGLERHSQAAGGREMWLARVAENHGLSVANVSDCQGLLEDKAICVKRVGC